MYFPSLRENSIGVEGAKNMAHALHENSSLQDLEWVASSTVVYSLMRHRVTQGMMENFKSNAITVTEEI